MAWVIERVHGIRELGRLDALQSAGRTGRPDRERPSIVGAAIGYDYGENVEGWIEQVAVEKAHRGQASAERFFRRAFGVSGSSAGGSAGSRPIPGRAPWVFTNMWDVGAQELHALGEAGSVKSLRNRGAGAGHGARPAGWTFWTSR